MKNHFSLLILTDIDRIQVRTDLKIVNKSEYNWITIEHVRTMEPIRGNC